MLANERSSGRRISSSERGELGFWPTVLSTVVATLILTAAGALVTDERIARPTAERFLREYYRQAVPAADRDHAWDMLTEDFQGNDDKLRDGDLVGGRHTTNSITNGGESRWTKWTALRRAE
jgi:hypothetical protein